MSDANFIDMRSFAELRHDPEIAAQWRPPALADVARRVRDCRRCPGLNLDPPCVESSTKSAPGYGSALSPVVIVGQSLCGTPCIEAQTPFTGGSGKLLDRAFAVASINKKDIFITNVVHCHPPANRASLPAEIANCSEYIEEELRILHPRLIIALGRDAGNWLGDWIVRSDDEWIVDARLPDSIEQTHRLLLKAPHPSWIKRHAKAVHIDYVNSLATALRWAFSDGASRPA